MLRFPHGSLARGCSHLRCGFDSYIFYTVIRVFAFMGHMLLHCGGFSRLLNLRGVPLESTYIYISCSPWRHSLLLSRGRLALSGRKAGVRRVGMIATLAKDPLAFGSVHKRGRTPTDQFSSLARALAFPMGCLRSKPYTPNHFGRL